MEPSNQLVAERDLSSQETSLEKTTKAKKKISVTLLGAGKPFTGSNPAVLSLTPDNRLVLDWVFDAFSPFQTNFHVVSGYHHRRVIQSYPDLAYSINPEWENTGTVGSLLYAPLDAGKDHYVLYSDILFRRQLIQQLDNLQGDIVLAVDSHWKSRFKGRNALDLQSAEKVIVAASQTLHKIDTALSTEEADAEFIGIVRFSPAVVHEIQKLRDSQRDTLKKWSLPSLIQCLMGQGFTATVHDVAGDWAELNYPQDLARFVLGTKAETLSRLRPLVCKSVIGESVIVPFADWQDNPQVFLSEIQQVFSGKQVIVRSSARSEDCWEAAQAGVFLSLPNIDTTRRNNLKNAIDQVFNSYSDGNQDNQVLIQEMLDQVQASGVVFTRTLTHGAPYYVVNYDDQTGRTDTVTQGENTALKTATLYRYAAAIPEEAPPFFKKLIASIQELELLVGHSQLDIEFALLPDNTICILQLRPLVVSVGQSDEKAIQQRIEEAKGQFLQKQTPPLTVVGEKALFGVMPDWNPAEIIGINPKRLSFGLYQDLILNGVWATQRAEMGYRDVRPHPLMHAFAGTPYIDIRASVNSFIPASVPEPLAEKLANYYLKTLAENPAWHDKIEFSVVLTCLSFNFDTNAAKLLNAGFTEPEINGLKQGLADVTKTAIKNLPTYYETLVILDGRYKAIAALEQPPLEKAFCLLDDARRFGTLPFAHLARCGFIAITLLKEAVSRQIISEERLQAYLASIETVAKTFSHDFDCAQSGKIPWEQFIEKFGHLRPGTYDITALPYAKAQDMYFGATNFSTQKKPQKKPQDFNPVSAQHHAVSVSDSSPSWRWFKATWQWTNEEETQLQAALDALGLTIEMDTLDDFLRKAIEGREYAKYLFSRNLSLALELFADYGNSYGMDRSAMAHVSLEDLVQLRAGFVAEPVSEWLKASAKKGASWYKHTQAIELPALITKVQDFDYFVWQDNDPNFVGAGSITAPLFHLKPGQAPTETLSGLIVLIPQADPGYDWLFSHQIAGLITAYGGANSHMAIRAAEFGLPAAIGIGEKQYQLLQNASYIQLDAAARSIRII
ncbi:MAG: PEP-utilizing enzyme [Cyanobacteria bacterium P01_H01_bin.74]